MTIEEISQEVGLDLDFNLSPPLPGVRGSGRTTRMLLSACADAHSGLPVMIVAALPKLARDYAARLQSWVRHIGGQPRLILWSYWPKNIGQFRLAAREAVLVHEARSIADPLVLALVEIIQRLTCASPPPVFDALRGLSRDLRIYCDHTVDEAFEGHRPSLEPVGRTWAN